MSRPAKIKKPKSFMFTTKHHSFSGIMGCILAAISLITIMGSIYMAFVSSGKSSVLMGSEAMFALILDFIGIISGVTGLMERDIHKWEPIAAIIVNGLMLIIWILLVLWGRQ